MGLVVGGVEVLAVTAGGEVAAGVSEGAFVDANVESIQEKVKA